MIIIDNVIIKKDLLDKIEGLRTDMIRTGLEEGFTSDSTILISQLLDCLLNELDEMQSLLPLSR